MTLSFSLKAGFISVAFAFLLSAGRAFADSDYVNLEAARQKWIANHPHEYAFTYQKSCYCNNPVWRVSVKGDSVVRVENISPSAPGTGNSNLQIYSMDSIFAQVKAGLDAHPASAQFRYNARLGYPEEASFNPRMEIADDEYSIGVHDFLAATPADTLAFNYAKWMIHRPEHYAFTYSLGITCSCVYPVWRVEARGDTVVRVTHKSGTSDTTRPNADLQYYSMDNLFARIRMSLDSNPDAYAIKYDAQMGFPVSAYFYPDTSLMDAGYTHNVTELENLTVALRKPRPASRGGWAGLNLGADPGMGRDLRGRVGPRSGASPVFILRQ